MQISSVKSARRDKFFIIAEILEIGKEKVLKTQIMYKANLSFTQLNNYLKFLLENDLLSRNESEGKETYLITEKGLDFLQKYYELTKLTKKSQQK
jgi:predicted transcriptional regulator